jgi:hypothetical protein
MAISQALKFPPGISGFQDRNGNKVVPDANGLVTITDQNLLASYLAAGFTYPVTKPVASLTDAATINIDFTQANDFTVTLGGNRTLANPTNLAVGQQGLIRIAQDGTGNRTLAFGTFYKFSGGSKTLSTAASAIDTISYEVVQPGEILCELLKAYA